MESLQRDLVQKDVGLHSPGVKGCKWGSQDL